MRVGLDLPADERRGDLEEDLLVLEADRLDAVEGLQDLGVRAQPKRAQEDRPEELPLPVDADVEEVLGVVLELHPGAAVRNDLRHVKRLGRVRLEEDARRSVELGDDHALRAVDDEGPVLGQHGDLAEVDLLLLDVADAAGAGLGVLVVHLEVDRHLERNRVGHAPLLALRHVVLELERDRVPALVAGAGRVPVDVAALGARYLEGLHAGDDELPSAARAGRAEVLDADEGPALALPLTDGIFDELQAAVLPEIGDREDRPEHRLQAGLLPVRGRRVHLQEALVGALLHLDQIGDLDRRADLRKIDPLPDRAVGIWH